MRRLTTTLLCTLALCLTIAPGCSDDLDKDPTAPPVTLEAAPQRLAEVICSRVDLCCSEEERRIALAEVEAETIAECEEAIRVNFTEDFEDVVEAERAGRLRVDAQRFGNCIAGFESASCAQGLEAEDSFDTPDCEAAIVPLVDNGDECTRSMECKSGVCHRVFDDQGIVVSGRCKAIGAAGDACEWSDECEDGLYCGAQDTCQRIGQRGDTCASGFDSCVEGLFCNGEADSAEGQGICQELAELGESCQDYDSCAGAGDDLYCDNFRFDGTEATNTCKAYPGRGESCSDGQCAEGSRCDEQRVCSAPLTDGEPCERSYDCASGYCDYGDDATGTCAPSTRDICQGG